MVMGGFNIFSSGFRNIDIFFKPELKYSSTICSNISLSFISNLNIIILKLCSNIQKKIRSNIHVHQSDLCTVININIINQFSSDIWIKRNQRIKNSFFFFICTLIKHNIGLLHYHLYIYYVKNVHSQKLIRVSSLK